MNGVLTVTALSLGLSLAALGAPAAQKPPEKRTKKVWTNEELEQLRSTSRWSPGVVSSSVGEPAAEEKEKAAGEKEKAAKEKPLPPEKDPKFYRSKLTPLRADLDQLDAQIKQLRDTLSNPIEGSSNAMNLRAPRSAMRPEDQLAQLEARRKQLQTQIDDLEDAARRNGLSPGEIR